METQADPSCPNCGAYRDGLYCSECGQKDRPLRQSTWLFIKEAINEYFGIDGRLWLTLRLLLLKPGELTNETLRGRRARYLAPLRLYLTATVIFFALLSIFDPVAAIEQRAGGAFRDSTMTAAARMEAIDSTLARQNRRVDRLQLASAAAAVELDSLLASFRTDSLSGVLADSSALAAAQEVLEEAREEAEDDEDDWLDEIEDNLVDERRLAWQREVLGTYPPDSTIRPADLVDAASLIYPEEGGLNVDVTFLGESAASTTLKRITDARTGTERRQAISDFSRSAIGRIPIVMFFMLPVFALIMKMVFLRRDWYYSEHLIYALHNHAFAFFSFGVVTLIIGLGGGANWTQAAANIILWGTGLYYLGAQKRVYGQGWRKTILKYLIVFWLYLWAVLIFGISMILLLTAVFG